MLPLAAKASVTLDGFVPDVGTARDVVVDSTGTHAYVASQEFGLTVVDISNATQPVAVGGANPPFYGWRVAVSGSLAAVAGGTMGLNFVDVSTPTAPTTVATVSGAFNSVALAGQYAYPVQTVPGNPSHTDLVVMDVSTPATPSRVGSITVAGDAAIKVVGGFAYIAAGTSGLQIVNVSTPTAPAIVKTVDTPGTAKGVVVSGNYAYVADTTSVEVIDIHSPGSAAIVGSLSMTSTSAVAVAGTQLYVIDAGLLKVVNISTPTAPVLQGSTTVTGAQNLDATGSTVFLASSSIPGGLYVVNAVVPLTPIVVANLYGAFGSAGVAASGSLAVASGDSAGMKVVDISTPSAPRVVGSLNPDATGGTYSGIKGVALAGNYAYALLNVPGNPGHIDLGVVDLTIPAVPAVLAQLTLAGGTGIQVSGGYVYVSCGSAGLQIVDVSIPTSPRIVATVNTPDNAKGVALASGYAYVADNSSVQVVDVHNPAAAFIAGSFSTSMTTVSAIAVAGNRVFVIDGQSLKILDISTPTNPTLLSSSSAYSAQAIAASNGMVYLARPALAHSDTAGGVYTVDVSNPVQPQLVTQLIVPGTTRAVAATASYVYAGDSAAVVDVGAITAASPPSTPPPSSSATPTQTPTSTRSATANPTSTSPPATSTPTNASTGEATPTPTGATTASLGSFHCYSARVTKGTTKFTTVLGVSLVDRFNRLSRDVLPPSRLCNPANLKGLDPSAPTRPDHLTGYNLRTPAGSPAFAKLLGQRMVNQFGSFSVDVLKPVQVLIAGAQSLREPAPMPTPGVDSFDCYTVRLSPGLPNGETLPAGADVEDEFGTLKVNVKAPTMVCAPVNLENTTTGADTHPDLLTCYRVTAASGSAKFTKVTPVFVTNELEDGTLDALSAHEICVPTQINPT